MNGIADLKAIARAATLVEAQTGQGRALIQEVFPKTGRALTLGVTGPPGAGKSTLVNRLITAFRTEKKTVAVIAVDPSSPYSRGALLGDRVRMLEHYNDPGVFIRSMATRGRLGGVAATTLDLVLLLDAAGFDTVIVETVGVGQDELDIAHLAGVTILVLTPHSGDEIQVLKAGILEVSDIVVINKSDTPGADRLQNALHDAKAQVLKVSAQNNEGILELMTAIQACPLKPQADLWAHRLLQKLRDHVVSQLPPGLLAEHARMVADKRQDPYSAIIALKARWQSN